MLNYRYSLGVQRGIPRPLLTAPSISVLCLLYNGMRDAA